MTESLPFVRAVAEELARQVRSLRGRLFETHAFTVPARVRFELFRMAAAAGIAGNRAVLHDSPTHAELAAFIGAQREAVTREYQRLVRRGVIGRRGRALEIVDVVALASAIDELGSSVEDVAPWFRSMRSGT
jgi:CRP-like cAMP-binding protein